MQQLAQSWVRDRQVLNFKEYQLRNILIPICSAMSRCRMDTNSHGRNLKKSLASQAEKEEADIGFFTAEHEEGGVTKGELKVS